MPKKAPPKLTQEAHDYFLDVIVNFGNVSKAVREFAKAQNKSEKWGWGQYGAVKRDFEAQHANINEQIEKDAISIQESIKGALKTKFEYILDLENEIQSLCDTLEKGYIVKTIKVRGEEREKVQIFEAKEYKQFADMIKDKREQLFKLRNFYTEEVIKQAAQEVLTAKGLTDEERERKIKEILEK